MMTQHLVPRKVDELLVVEDRLLPGQLHELQDLSHRLPAHRVQQAWGEKRHQVDSSEECRWMYWLDKTGQKYCKDES